MNQLQALAMNEGYCWKKLFSEQGRALLEKLSLAPWASRRRQELLELLDRMNPIIEELTAAVEREARKRPEAMRLMTHPGVGPITALAYVLIIGTLTRFQVCPYSDCSNSAKRRFWGRRNKVETGGPSKLVGSSFSNHPMRATSDERILLRPKQ